MGKTWRVHFRGAGLRVVLLRLLLRRRRLLRRRLLWRRLLLGDMHCTTTYRSYHTIATVPFPLEVGSRLFIAKLVAGLLLVLVRGRAFSRRGCGDPAVDSDG